MSSPYCFSTFSDSVAEGFRLNDLYTTELYFDSSLRAGEFKIGHHAALHYGGKWESKCRSVQRSINMGDELAS